MKAAVIRASRSRGARSGAGRLVVLTRPLCPLPLTTAAADASGPAPAEGVRTAGNGSRYDFLLVEALGEADSDASADFEADALEADSEADGTATGCEAEGAAAGCRPGS